jgi:hypothetical protein
MSSTSSRVSVELVYISFNLIKLLKVLIFSHKTSNLWDNHVGLELDLISITLKLVVHHLISLASNLIHPIYFAIPRQWGPAGDLGEVHDDLFE